MEKNTDWLRTQLPAVEQRFGFITVAILIHGNTVSIGEVKYLFTDKNESLGGKVKYIAMATFADFTRQCDFLGYTSEERRIALISHFMRAISVPD